MLDFMHRRRKAIVCSAAGIACGAAVYTWCGSLLPPIIAFFCVTHRRVRWTWGSTRKSVDDEEEMKRK